MQTNEEKSLSEIVAEYDASKSALAATEQTLRDQRERVDALSREIADRLGIQRPVVRKSGVRVTESRKRILDVLRAASTPMHSTDIAAAIGRKAPYTQALISTMTIENLTRRVGRGVYAIAS